MNEQKMIRNQSGFSLIELMMAITIISVLLAAMYQNFIITHRTYQLLEGFSLLQENARFSSDLMARTIRMAGFKINPQQDKPEAFPAANVAPLMNFFAPGQLVAGTNGVTDSISVRYQAMNNQPGSPATDCIGRNVSSGDTSVNTFYVDATGTLQCQSVELSPAGAVVGGAGSNPLIEGVEDMQVLYGIDGNGDLTADNYLNAAQVTNWLAVVSVRISLLYTTVNKVNQNSPQSFTMLDNGIKNFNDGLRRQLFTATINLRNESR